MVRMMKACIQYGIAAVKIVVYRERDVEIWFVFLRIAILTFNSDDFNRYADIQVLHPNEVLAHRP
ncbi:MAG: hypothetical protein LAQ69_03265 [Acidobacteriia bacterium]|nr:hypothetical protein [Terriglobia bacterium]